MDISGIMPNAVQGSIAPAAVREQPQASQPEQQKPVTDEYLPEQRRDPSGRYWPGRDEDNKPKIYFDAPEQEKAPETAGANKKPDGDKAESCTCNTDKVDREIEKLKQKLERLEQQYNAETDAAKRRELEQKLAQVKSELSQKDNDAYRRQHASFS